MNLPGSTRQPGQILRYRPFDSNLFFRPSAIPYTSASLLGSFLEVLRHSLIESVDNQWSTRNNHALAFGVSTGAMPVSLANS